MEVVFEEISGGINFKLEIRISWKPQERLK
jgi:hypothetical protein